MVLPNGIRQRGTALMVDVTVRGIRRTSTVASGDLQQALLKRTELQAELLRTTSTDTIVGSAAWTLQQAYERTCALHWHADRCKSWRKLRQNAEKVLDHFGCATLVSNITSEKVDEYIIAVRRRGVSGATINRHTAALSKMLTVAMDKGRLDRKPKIERSYETPGRIRYLTDEEETNVLGVMKTWGMMDQRDVTMVLLDTGLRPSELWALQPIQIHPATNMLHVWISKGKVARSIPMTPRVRRIIGERMHMPRLFPHDNYWYEAAWNRVRMHLGLKEDKEFIPYALRHTFASRLVQDGEDLLVVKGLMGHKNILTTQRYAHLAPKNYAKAIERLAKRRVENE